MNPANSDVPTPAAPSPSDRPSDAYEPTVKATPTPFGERRPPDTARRAPSEPSIPPEVADAPAAARFGKFVRTRRLGAGGMGEVWKAWDTQLARWVALKFLMGGDEEEIARFRREAQTAGRLHHPRIAAIYEVDEDQGRHYIAMQYVEGHTLKTFPRNDPKLLVKLIADAAEALQYAHDQGVVHRDLKPENLMVASRPVAGREEHHVFVMDFGLARAAEGASHLSHSGLVVGTPSYMPPEQARGERVDARADVYGLGATLYEILTDRRPFQASNVYETLKLVQEEEPRAPRRLNPQVPRDLETIVLKCLAKEPSQRYPSAQSLAEDLVALNAGESIRARPEGVGRKLWRRARRNPLALAAAGALALAVAVTAYVAPKASRDRQVAGLIQRIDAELGGAWSAERAKNTGELLAELERVSPEEARSARARRDRSLAEAARQSFQSGDRDRALALRALLAAEDPERAADLEREFRQREAIWPTVMRLEPPFADLRAVFEKGKVLAEGDLLRLPAGAPAGPVLTRTPCQGNVELRAEFDASWRGASELGLLLNGTRRTGYRYLVVSIDPSARAPAAPPPPSFEELAAGKGPLFLVIKRNEVVLRQEALPASALVAAGPLRLLARREGDRLTFQANDSPPVVFRDPFPLVSLPQDLFGLHWPAPAALRRLQAGRQELPTSSSPLWVGDAHFVQARYEDALACYREAALASSLRDVRQEARYKEALCHLQANREDEARRLFEEVSGQHLRTDADQDMRWSFLSDCQLILLAFGKKGGLDEASARIDKLSTYKTKFDELALLIPQDVQRTLLNNAFVGTVGGLHRKPEENVALLEFGNKASDLLEPPPGPVWKRFSLLRAYRLAGREAEAMRWAERMFRSYGYTGDAVDDYCWMLRLRGEHARALEAADRAAADPDRRIERARIYAARGEWEKAREDVEAYVARPLSYFGFSAACLLEGFLAERRGDAAGAEASWRRGLKKYWKPPPRAKEEDWGNGSPILHNWIMSSLTGDMTDADGEQMFSSLLSFAGRDNPVLNRLMRPSMLRASWRTPRGRELARRIAFRDLGFPEWALHPMFLGWVAFLHEIAFPPEPLSAEQDELLFRFAQDFYAAFLDGHIAEKHLLPLGVILQGNPNTPGMGWREMSSLLERAPKVRGPLAYVLGHRYLKRGEKPFARAFFKQAVADAASDPLLLRLAQAELARLPE